MTENGLSLLLESISGLSEASGDFRVEEISKTKVAVITFLKNIDVGTFVNVCDGHHRAQPLQIFPRFLELTRTIRVEKLPPHVNNNYITIFSENPPKGEGVTNVHYFSDESSALVEFSDYRVVDTFLTKKLVCSEKPISVFPYYVPLDITLHGRKKPLGSTIPGGPESSHSKDQVSWKDCLSIRNDLVSTQTKEGLNLVLISGDVSYFCADVIVNTVPMDLQLGRGSLSQTLLQRAGPMLQKELNATRQNTEEEVGSIFMTSGCNLDCKAVLHVVAPVWDNGAGSSWQIMANIIRKCLKTTEQLSFSSITFPMIGTGNLGFPKAIFAERILSEVFKYSSHEWLKTLQEVQFLVHLDDDEGCQAFLHEFTTCSSRNPSKDTMLVARGSQGIFGTVTNPKPTTYEMKIGAISFQVAIGDITKESTDVIVNSTTKMFNLKLGVSKAILEGAGQAVEDEYAQLATQPHRDFIITQGGHLMCKIIIHVVEENDVRKTIASVLEECEQRQHTSAALPAIGTGNTGKNPIRVADDIISAIVDFTQKHPTPSLKEVKVVVLVPELLNVFYDNMKKREIFTSPTSQSIVSKFAFSGLYGQPTIIHGKNTGTVKHNLLSIDYSPEGQNPVQETGTANELKEDKRGNIPEYWTDMNQQTTCMIQLQPGQSEYNCVKDKFLQTGFFYKIEKIERIQNAFLWQSYQIKKKQMDIKNGHTHNERILFHGTDADSVLHINHHGFNRSYAGKNAVTYGKGTYFAVDASYSANDNYSKPDSNGRKHIYVVRVLTGVYTLGHAGLIIPPSKNPYNHTDLFDSVTDNMQHPTLFVVFFDNQAYPEYLITFRC